MQTCYWLGFLQLALRKWKKSIILTWISYVKKLNTESSKFILLVQHNSLLIHCSATTKQQIKSYGKNRSAAGADAGPAKKKKMELDWTHAEKRLQNCQTSTTEVTSRSQN